mgnify:CR=1 FL=1
MARQKKPTSANLEFETGLWEAANALRGSLDAAGYKHVVLGLIFLKYISDAFEACHKKREAVRDQGADPEDPNECRAENIFWVSPKARWAHLRKNARQPTIGRLVDDAMAAVERDNTSLKGVLPLGPSPTCPRQTPAGRARSPDQRERHLEPRVSHRGLLQRWLRLICLRYPRGSTSGARWLQHLPASMTDLSRLALPRWTRGSPGEGSKGGRGERNIREESVEHDLVEVLVLLQRKLFSVPVPGIVLLVNNAKRHPGIIFLINASRPFFRGRPTNHPTEQRLPATAGLTMAGGLGRDLRPASAMKRWTARPPTSSATVTWQSRKRKGSAAGPCSCC